MPERLRFRQVSKIRLTEEEEAVTHKATAELVREPAETLTFEYPVYDVLLESVSFSPKIQLLDTKVKRIAPKQVPVTLVDLPVRRMVRVEEAKMVATDVLRVETLHEVPSTTDVHLVESQIRMLPVVMNTEVPRKVQKEITRGMKVMSSFDISLVPRIVSEQIQALNTEVITTEVESGIETLRLTEEAQLPIFEEFIGSDGWFPRSFSESLNSPLILLIGEDEREWHIPIIYVLKELFREITDRHPRVTFREPEVL
ncbi:MAG: hypothetical protein ACTSXX_09025, partial [Candidatus Baldrarchaeia archaeon]